MDLKKTLEKINKGREKAEFGFLSCVFKDPELFEEYRDVNVGKDKFLQLEDSKFYWALGQRLYASGVRTIDALAVDTFLEGKEKALKKYERYGGFSFIEDLQALATTENVNGYYDRIAKMNSLCYLAESTENLFDNLDKLDSATSEEVYEVFEQINNDISLHVNHSEKIENLVADDDFIAHLESGENIGFNYGKFCPNMNYITLGAAPGEMFMIGGASGVGKSSFTFGNIIMGLHYQKDIGKIAILSNEMKRDTYRVLLLLHILTKDMKYYGLTQKQIKKGQFNEEQREKIKEAERISKEQYSDLIFIKTFDNDIGKILKYIKHLKTMGVGTILYDTFKADDALLNKSIWETLLMDSRRIFQLCSRLNICCLTTYQLALHKQNLRYLDATCLSNGKQIKEIYSSMIYMRPVWTDEYHEAKYDIKPWRFKRDENNKYVTDENGKWIKEEIILDDDEKYMLFFVDKTRADEDKQILLYRWRPRFNEFKELGYANVTNAHIYS